jgi:pimeloyl-ACP methyl ester carboxylesterase
VKLLAGLGAPILFAVVWSLFASPDAPRAAHGLPRGALEIAWFGAGAAAMAAMVDELLEALGLEDVVLVGNDAGGAIARIVATSTPARPGALVLTSCDAFGHFPPRILKPFIPAPKFPPAFHTALQPLRTRLGRRRAYGALAHTDIDDLAAEWIKPALRAPRIRADLRRLTASLNRQTIIQAGARLPRVTKPALIAWSPDDAFFPLDDGRRLAATLPDCRLEVMMCS